MRIRNLVTVLLAGTMLFSTGSVKGNNTDYTVGGGIRAYAEDESTTTTTVTFEAQYMQSDARSMLAKINAFRKGDEAWQWNETNTQKVQVSNLNDLQYDADLEAIAMQRVAEIAVDFEHTRPNGEICYSYTSNGVKAYGENIAIGTSLTCDDVFEGWKETDENYAGQGHRRNMLRTFKSIGIAHAKINGWDCWVQEFSWYDAGQEGTAYNGTTTATVEVADSRVGSCTPDTSQYNSSYTLSVDESMDLPAVVVNQLQLTDPFVGGITCNVDCGWTSSDSSILEVSNGTVIGKAVGTATLTAKPFGKAVKISVEVKDETTPTPTPTPTAKPEPKKGWVKKNGNWYYQIDGKNQTGWVKYENNWYFMNSNGVMQKGWLKQGGTWYYLKSSGAMATGWVSVDGKWYYMNASGVMVTGWVEVGNAWYYMSESGMMVTGWMKSGNSWYYMKSSGVMATGWVSSNGKWYYMNNNGAMATGWVKDGKTYIRDNWYYMDETGAMKSNCWIASGSDWYYLSGNGKAFINTIAKVDGEYYYFDDSAKMRTNVWVPCHYFAAEDEYLYACTSLYPALPEHDVANPARKCDIYVFGADGVALSGWQYLPVEKGTWDNHYIEYHWLYFEPDGELIGDRWIGNYYLNKYGEMETDCWIGDWYVGSDGLWVPGKTKE